MGRNAEIEMRWVDAWNDLLDLARGRHDVLCLLPDGVIVGVEECKGWLQDSVYEGHLVRVEAGHVAGRSGVLVTRS